MAATKRVLLGTWVEPDEAERIREAAEREHRTVSQFIRLTMVALTTSTNGKAA